VPPAQEASRPTGAQNHPVRLRPSTGRALGEFLADLGSAAHPGGDGLTPALLAGLSGVIGCDSVWRADCDYGNRRNAMLSTDHRVDVAYSRKQERWWQLYGQHPLLAYRDATGNGRALRLSDFLPRRSLRRLELYSEFFKPFGIESSLSIRIYVSPRRAVDIGCTRSSGDFSVQDRFALDIVKSFLERIGLLDDRRSRTSKPLTRREREVLAVAATGASNAEIAAELVIAPGTAKKHLDNIYAKLGAANRTEAVARMLDSGNAFAKP
jgi:DNA-binding CsgD family transcriptional regulator